MADDILGYIFDADEIPEQDQFEARLEADPQLRNELEAAREAIAPLACDDVIEPPLGLAARAFENIQHARIVGRSTDYEWAGNASRPRAVDFAVATTILGIAATLVFPAIASMRGDHARVVCAENLRRIGVSLSMYAQKEKNQFPVIATQGPLNMAGSFAMALKSDDLLTDVHDLLCPAANSGIVLVPGLDQYLASREYPPQYERNRKFMSGSYGYALGFRNGDGHLAGYDRSASYTPLVADRPPRPEETLFMNSPNHGDQGQNVLYVDGTVRWLPFSNVNGDDLFHNRHCEVAAGLDAGDVVIGVSEATPLRNTSSNL